MHPADVSADLAQSHGKQVQPLEADGFIGCHQHPAALVQAHQIFLRADLGLGDLRALLHTLQRLLLLGGDGGDGAVIHPVKAGHGSGDIRQDAFLLHALAHHTGYKFGKQHCRLRIEEKLFHAVAADSLDLDVKAFQLALKSIHALQGGAVVMLAGIQLLQRLAEAVAAAAIHALFQLDVFKMISHIHSPPYSTKVTVLPAASTSATR